MTGPSGTFLARRVAAGDEYAFRRLAERYEPMILGNVREIPGQELDDARQACLLGLLGACHAIMEDPRDLPLAAKVRMRSHVRAQWRHAEAHRRAALLHAARLLDTPSDNWGHEEVPVALDERYDPVRAYEARETLARIITAFGELTPAQRDALRKGHVPGRQQVANHRARQRLRKLAEAA